jgi:restriction system protein
MNPFTGENIDISPRDFEVQVKKHLESLGKEIKDFKVTHNVVSNSHDGEYQIDVEVIFFAFEVEFKVLVECKKYNSPIKRDMIQILKDKIERLGAHKGIIYTTSGFQSGAIRYAKEHGIALVKIVEGKALYEVRGNTNHEIPPWVQLPDYALFQVLAASESSFKMVRIDSDNTDRFQELFHKL